jgi:signal transduction histidine kinase
MDDRLSPEGELALFRIVQEALSNVARHALASHARVTLREVDGAVEAVVEDDGCGFDPAAQEAARPCLGLFGMRERALYVGGEVEVRSTPGAGTRVRIRIPLPSPPRAHP